MPLYCSGGNILRYSFIQKDMKIKQLLLYTLELLIR